MSLEKQSNPEFNVDEYEKFTFNLAQQVMSSDIRNVNSYIRQTRANYFTDRGNYNFENVVEPGFVYTFEEDEPLIKSLPEPIINLFMNSKKKEITVVAGKGRNFRVLNPSGNGISVSSHYSILEMPRFTSYHIGDFFQEDPLEKSVREYILKNNSDRMGLIADYKLAKTLIALAITQAIPLGHPSELK